MAADLLLAVERDAEVDGQRVRLDETLCRFQDEPELALVVGDAAAVRPLAADVELERVGIPQIERCGRLDVEVVVDEHGRRVARAIRGADLAEHELALAERRQLGGAADAPNQVADPLAGALDVLPVGRVGAHTRDCDQLRQLGAPGLVHECDRMLRPMRFAEVTLSAPLDLRDFYGGELGLPLDGDAIVVGETRLRFDVEEAGAFYHFAFLVPGDRFAAALEWARGRVALLGDVFEFENWDAEAVYFHDPAGSIVELIAHHGLEENGRHGPFAADELVGFSELGIVGDRPRAAPAARDRGPRALERDRRGAGPARLRRREGPNADPRSTGRGWLPTGRPAEPHPVEYVLAP